MSVIYDKVLFDFQKKVVDELLAEGKRGIFLDMSLWKNTN